MAKGFFGGLLVLLLVGASQAAVVPIARQGELVNLLRHDCGSCHGLTLKGGLGPALLPQNLSGKSEEILSAIILDGLHGTPMPPWRGLLAEDEVRWIVQYLKSGVTP